MLIFAHIPFVVHRAFNAALTERLQPGCEAGTQISGSGSRSRHLKFLAPDLYAAAKSLWIRFQNDLVQNRKSLYYMCNSLAPQTRVEETESKFHVPSASDVMLVLKLISFLFHQCVLILVLLT